MKISKILMLFGVLLYVQHSYAINKLLSMALVASRGFHSSALKLAGQEVVKHECFPKQSPFLFISTRANPAFSYQHAYSMFPNNRGFALVTLKCIKDIEPFIQGVAQDIVTSFVNDQELQKLKNKDSYGLNVSNLIGGLAAEAVSHVESNRFEGKEKEIYKLLVARTGLSNSIVPSDAVLKGSILTCVEDPTRRENDILASTFSIMSTWNSVMDFKSSNAIARYLHPNPDKGFIDDPWNLVALYSPCGWYVVLDKNGERVSRSGNIELGSVLSKLQNPKDFIEVYSEEIFTHQSDDVQKSSSERVVALHFDPLIKTIKSRTGYLCK